MTFYPQFHEPIGPSSKHHFLQVTSIFVNYIGPTYNLHLFMLAHSSKFLSTPQLNLFDLIQDSAENYHFVTQTIPN